MILRVGPQLKPFSSYRRVRWRRGSPVLWAIADQGGSFIDASDNRYALATGFSTHVGVMGGATGPVISYDGTAGIYTSGPAINVQPPFTVSARVRFNAVTVRCDFFGKWNTAAGAHETWLLSMIGSPLNFYFYLSQDGAAATGLNSGFTPSAGVWYYVCGTYDGTTRRIYVNGQLKASDTPGCTSLHSSTQAILLGNSDLSSTNTLNGQLDDCRIYNYALTPAQILADYLDPWWRLRRMRPRWMGQASAPPAATLFRRTLYRRTGSRGVA